MKNPTPRPACPPPWLRFAALAAAAFVGCAGCARKAPDPAQNAATTARDVALTPAQQSHIRLYTVVPAQYRRTIETNGTVDFDGDRSTSVLAPFSGPVSRLLVSVGDRVAKGAPLAVVDSPDFATAIAAYRKALASARTARRLADLEADLLKHHGISQREEEQAQADAAGAEADRDAALQTLISLNVDPRSLADLRAGRPVARVGGVIRAPIGGTVVERPINPGELLQAGSTPCFTIADLSHVWVMAQIFGADVDAVRLGDSADVSTGTGTPMLTGTLTNVAAEVDPNTRSVVGRISVANPQGLLRRQMYVRVKIHSRRASRGLLIPVSAVLRDDENLPFVYLAEADGRFARRHVQLGYRAGGRYDIAGGLRAGDRVVVDGALFLQFIQNQ